MVRSLLYLCAERRFLQPDNPLNTVPRRKIFLYWFLQVIGVAATVAISQTVAAIGFPVLIIALIPLRACLMPRWFTEHELGVLDDLTANNKCVVASLGGIPSSMETDRPASRSTDTSNPQKKSEVDLERGKSTGTDHDIDLLRRQRSRNYEQDLRRLNTGATRPCVGSLTRQSLHRPTTREGHNYDRHERSEQRQHHDDPTHTTAIPVHRQRAGSIARD
jgi:hypothetical protein